MAFIDEIKAINIKSKAAIVRWVGKFDSDKYRVGLEFV